MKLTTDELEFLSAWAREEWEPACYQLPAHHLQLAHGVAGAELILLIKAWTESEGRKDQDILAVGADSQLRWPWSTTEEFRARLVEASRISEGLRQPFRVRRSTESEPQFSLGELIALTEGIDRQEAINEGNVRDFLDGLERVIRDTIRLKESVGSIRQSGRIRR